MPTVKGFPCPVCKGVRLMACGTRYPAPGITVRYRRCTACGHKIVTRERVWKVIKQGVPPAG